jgi:hypothetical protein
VNGKLHELKFRQDRFAVLVRQIKKKFIVNGIPIRTMKGLRLKTFCTSPYQSIGHCSLRGWSRLISQRTAAPEYSGKLLIRLEEYTQFNRLY